MNRPWRIPLVVFLATPFALLLACGNAKDAPVAPVPADNVTVTGEVIEIDDQVPVDAGATITVATQGGGKEYLLFPSLHTYPPPSQEIINLYDLVRRVEVGDLIRAEGKRTSSGVHLQSLAILEGQP